MVTEKSFPPLGDHGLFHCGLTSVLSTGLEPVPFPLGSNLILFYSGLTFGPSTVVQPQTFLLGSNPYLFS